MRIRIEGPTHQFSLGQVLFSSPFSFSLCILRVINTLVSSRLICFPSQKTKDKRQKTKDQDSRANLERDLLLGISSNGISPTNILILER